MKTTRILAVAPYEGLKGQISECAQGRSDIEVDVLVGDLDSGAESACAYPKDKYDVILSRGGTAEMIKQRSDVPVIDILPTVYDLLRVIHLARNYDGKFAVVGFQAITRNSDVLFGLLQQKVDVFTISNAGEACETIEKLKKDGYSLIIGDAIAISISKNMHLNGILITSGSEGIHAAFDEAVKINEYLCGIKNKNAVNAGIFDRLAKMKMNIVQFDAADQMIFSTLPDADDSGGHIIKYLKKMMRQMTSETGCTVRYFKTDGEVHKISGHRENSGFLFFTETRTDSPLLKKPVVFGDGFPEKTDGYPFDNIGEMQHVYEQARIYAKTDEPVHIIAPPGTDTGDLISTIHRHSKNKPFSVMTVDCSLIDKKDTFRLFNSENSSFGLVNMTIFFKHFDRFDHEQIKLFASYADESALLKRNRIIFETRECIEDPGIHDFLCKNECLKLYIPFLSQRKKDIPSLISLYIDYYNLRFGKHIIGIEPDAAEYLTLFPWQRNIEQLRQIVKNIVLNARNDTVATADVYLACGREPDSMQAVSGRISLSGSLHEINRAVLQTVLKEENGNKSKTAQRLGISRSTLWRLMNST